MPLPTSGPIFMAIRSEWVSPLSSVTVNTTEYSPAAAYGCATVLPSTWVPSPNSQAYFATCPSGSELREASKLAVALPQSRV